MLWDGAVAAPTPGAGNGECQLLLQHQEFFTTPPAKAFFKASAAAELPQDPGVGGGRQEELAHVPPPWKGDLHRALLGP